MLFSPRERRELLAASHSLKPVVTLAPDGLSEAAVDQVRAAFTRRALLKVRIATEARAACDAAAAELTRRVPCELVARVGRVLVLYQPPLAGVPQVAAGPPGV